MGARFGIESLHGRWDVKNNHRGYGIARKFGSGLKNPFGDSPSFVLSNVPVCMLQLIFYPS